MPRSTARDAVLDAVKPYVAGRESAEKELEKVGKKRVSTSLQASSSVVARPPATARVREVKRTRTRVERELRQRRTKAVRTVKQNRREAERQVKIDPPRVSSSRPSSIVSAGVASLGARCSRGTLPPARPERPARGKAAGQISRRQCSISPPSPAPSPRGRRWSFGPALLNWIRMPTREQIEDALRGVIDPELRKDIVTLGMVRSIEQPDDGHGERDRLAHHRRLSDPHPLREGRRREASRALGVPTVNVGFDVLSDQEKQALAQRLGRQRRPARRARWPPSRT